MSIQVPIDFEGRFEAVLDKFEKFSDKLDKKTKKTTKSMNFLENAVKAIGAKWAANKIIDGLEKITGKASEAEEANRMLVTSLVATHDATQVNVASYRALAEELANTSRYDDGMILSQVAIAKQFGVTNKEAAKLIRVAVDLSAATGEDLSTSVRNLGMTLDGTAGKMANQFPILQKLTAEQLRNGKAIDILGQMYAGAAGRSLDDFSGKQSKITKGYSNLLQAAGMVINKNPLVLESMDKLAQTFVKLTDLILSNTSTLDRWLTKFIAGTKVLAAVGLGIITRDLKFMLDAFAQYSKDVNGPVKVNDLFAGSMDKLAQKFDPVTGKFIKYNNALKEASGETGVFNFITGKMQNSFDEIGTKFNRAANELKAKYEEVKKSVEDIGSTELETLTNTYKKQADIIRRAAREGLDTRLNAAETLHKLELKNIREQNELRKKLYQEQVAKVQEAYANPTRALINGYTGNDGYNTGISDDNARAIGGGAGAFSDMLKGEEGARNTLSGIVSAVATAFLGPVGQVFGEIIGELTKGPEYVKKMMTEFFDSMPQLIENLILGLDEALYVFLDKWPQFLDRILDRLPEIVDRLIENLPRLFEALGRYILKIGELFLVGILKCIWKLLEGAGKFVWKILEGAGKFVWKILEGAGKFIAELIKGAGKAGKSIANGGGENFFSGDEGFVDDSVPVLGWLKGGGSQDPSAARRTQGGKQPMVVKVQIGNKDLASAILDLRKMGYSV